MDMLRLSILRPALLVLIVGSFTACQAPDSERGAAFVTLLGSDTLAIERFTRDASGMTADVVLRTPSVTRQTYRLELDENGHMTRFTSETREGVAATAALASSQTVERTEDGFLSTRTVDGTSVTDTLDAPPATLPFLDMIHWPYELMLERAYRDDDGVLEQPLLSGRQAMPFDVRRLSPDSMTVTHPFRGTMGVDVDDQGRLLTLDAAGTTRKLRVYRHAAIDFEEIAARFATLEAEGVRFGELSGRGEASAVIGGATIGIDYGQPLKRGRAIFGALVPYDEVWRTGANRATHFTTNRPLRFGDLDVPAGEYTLFTIPQPDGGTLMINTQTNQGGTTYNPDLDLGRVPLSVEPLDEVVEPFTIAIEPTDDGGVLKLMWDRTALVTPFTIQ